MMTVRVEGFPEVRRKLRKLENDLDRNNAKGELKAINKQAGEIVARRGRQLIPVRTGRLRDTIRSASKQTEASVKVGFKRVPYAGPIHFGWRARNITPQPFLYSALDSRRLEVLDHYQSSISKLIDRYGLD